MFMKSEESKNNFFFFNLIRISMGNRPLNETVNLMMETLTKIFVKNDEKFRETPKCLC